METLNEQYKKELEHKKQINRVILQSKNSIKSQQMCLNECEDRHSHIGEKIAVNEQEMQYFFKIKRN